VTSLLRRGADVYVVVDRGSPPFSHDRRAVPWDEVADVDHAGPAVKLRLSQSELDRAHQLDPDLGVEPGEGVPAPELRTTDVPAEARPRTFPTDGRRVADRPHLYAAALGVGLLAALGLLGAVALVTAGGGDLVPLFLVPILLGALALLLAYRLGRRPHERPRG
jgi:hypothetical protein